MIGTETKTKTKKDKIEVGKFIPVVVAAAAVAAESSWWGASIVLGAESAAIMPIRFEGIVIAIARALLLFYLNGDGVGPWIW